MMNAAYRQRFLSLSRLLDACLPRVRQAAPAFHYYTACKEETSGARDFPAFASTDFCIPAAPLTIIAVNTGQQ